MCRRPGERSDSSEYNVRIREIPSSERPRERLRDLGAAALSTAELLAIILRTGSARQSVLNLASSLLARHGGLGGLAPPPFPPPPPADDVVMTKQAREAGNVLGIELLDHVIIGDRRFASMKQLGLAFSG